MSEPILPASIIDALRDVTLWFDQEKVPNAIIGAVGVALIGQARATRDIDAVIWLDSDHWESLLNSAGKYGFTSRISDPIEFAKRSRVLLLEHVATGISVDISLGGLPFELEMISRALKIQMGDVNVSAASPEDLIVTKAIANRPKDIADIELIMSVRKDLDVARIRNLVHEFAIVLESPEIEVSLERVLGKRD